MDRVIGKFAGDPGGALVIAFGAVHGNEHAGVEAIRKVLQLLHEASEQQRDFHFSGNFIGVVGNMQAYQIKERFLDRDMNRMWTPAHLQRIRQTDRQHLHREDREIAELLALIHAELLALKPEVLVLLDLHTTSAEGGIFCIPADDPASLRLARELHAPVILGLLQGIEGTLLHFAMGNHFETGGFPTHTIGVAFESGQHADPASCTRAVAALINCLRASGCIAAESLPSQYDQLLLRYSNDLPKVTRIRQVHHIRPGDQFRMKPGYINFQPVVKGEHLADDVSGAILAPEDCRILMPLYQPLGADGFFLVEDVA